MSTEGRIEWKFVKIDPYNFIISSKLNLKNGEQAHCAQNTKVAAQLSKK